MKTIKQIITELSKHNSFGLRNIFIAALFCLATVESSYAGSTFKIDIVYSTGLNKIEVKWNSQGTGSQVQVARRVLGDVGVATWSVLGIVTQPTLNYIDNSVAAGITYEYQLAKQGDPTNQGYVAAGLALPIVEDRGTLLLVVDNTLSTPLASELKIFEQDLRGDGWNVVHYDSPRDGAGTLVGETLKAWIKTQYNANPTTVKAVMLFGHLPIIKSGWIAPDGHELRPHATDLFYADMDGAWTDATVNVSGPGGQNFPGDGIYDQDYIPGNNKVEVQISRIDFSGMTVYSSTELELSRSYLTKDHLWRHAVKNTPLKGIGGNGYLDIETSTLNSLFGSANVVNGTFNDTEVNAYTMGVDFGDYNGNNYPGYNYKIAFAVNFGSHKQNFENPNNPMREMLCMPEYGLSCVWGSRPNFFFHHMGMGQTVGYSAYRTFNNGNSEYSPACHYYFQGYIHMELVGDLSLRMHNVIPVKNLSAVITGSGVTLAWSASPDANIGYHVYMATTATGVFTRVTGSPITTTTYTDASPGATQVYMVKTVKLESVASGSYNNMSQGIFVEHPSYPVADVIAPSAPANLTFSNLGENSFVLKWDAAYDNKGVASYEVFKDGVSIGSTTGTTMSITGLTAFTRYGMTVKSKDAAGNASSSSIIFYVRTSVIQTVSTETYPSQIGDNAINGNINDKWTSQVNSGWMVLNYVTNRAWDKYEITSALDNPDRDPKDWFISASNDSISWTILDTQTARSWTARKQTNTYAFSNATAYKYYKLDITASNGSASNIQVGEFKFSNRTDTQAPTAPTSLIASGLSLTGFTLSWAASADNIGVVSYEVFRGTTTCGITTLTTMNITGLTPGTLYNITVKAKDADGNLSAASTILGVTTISDTQAPTVPPSFMTTFIQPTYIIFSWGASTDNIGVVAYELSKDGSVVQTITGLSGTISGITTLTAYSFGIRAFDAAGNRSAYNSFNITTPGLDVTPPSAPSGFTTTGITLYTVSGYSYFSLIWNPSTDNIGVKDYIVSKNGNAGSTITGTTLTGLYNPAGTTDIYQIRARDYAGNLSTITSLVVYFPDIYPPVYNGTYMTTVTSSYAFGYSYWSESSSITGLQIYLNGSIWNSATTVPGGPSFIYLSILGLNAGTVYALQYIATDTYGNVSALSSVYNFTTTGAAPPDTQAPTVPTSFITTTILQNSIAFSWTAATDNIGVSGYELSKGGIVVQTITGLTSTISGLTSFTGYTFAIRAFDAAGNRSAFSTTLNATTTGSALDTQAPTIPTSFTNTTVLQTSIRFSWVASLDNIGVSGYELSRGGVVVQTITGLTATVSGLTSMTGYAFAIRAFDAAGNRSAFSSNLNVTTTGTAPDTQAPTVPSSFATSTILQTSIKFFWTASSDNIGVAGYELSKGGVVIQTITGLTATVSGLTSMTGYAFAIRAFDAVGNRSAFSSTLSVTTSGVTPDTQVPTAPKSLIASVITFTGFKLSWAASTDNVGVVGYEVFRGAISCGTVTSTAMTITGLNPGTTYSITVVSWDAAGNISSASTVLGVTTLAVPDNQAPTAPTSLVALAISTNQFTLNWTASTDNVGVVAYIVFKAGVSCGTVTSTSMNVTGLAPGNTYGITVKARDAAGNLSPFSTVLGVTTLLFSGPDIQAPTSPTSLVASDITTTGFTLRWAASR